MTSIDTTPHPPGVQERARIKRSLITFVVLTFTLSTLGYIATVASGEASMLLLIAPGAAALITRYAFQRNIRGFHWQRPTLRDSATAYVLPFILSGAMFVLAWVLVGYYTTNNTDEGVLQSFVVNCDRGCSRSRRVRLWGGARLAWILRS